MKHRTWMACVLAAAVALPAAQAEMVVESWGGPGHFAHPGTMQIDEEGKQITFDLSALPARANVIRARLVCFREAISADDEQALVNVAIHLKGQDKPLEPMTWHDAFVVPASAVREGGKVVFDVRAFPGWIKEKTSLEIAYEGKGAEDLPVVSGVRAVHQPGQTFITWK